MNTVIRYLLVSAGSVVLLGTSARAEIVADDPVMKEALAEYEVFAGDYYAGPPKSEQGKREKKPFNLPQMLGRLFGSGKEDPESSSQ